MAFHVVIVGRTHREVDYVIRRLEGNPRSLNVLIATTGDYSYDDKWETRLYGMTRDIPIYIYGKLPERAMHFLQARHPENKICSLDGPVLAEDIQPLIHALHPGKSVSVPEVFDLDDVIVRTNT